MKWLVLPSHPFQNFLTLVRVPTFFISFLDIDLWLLKTSWKADNLRRVESDHKQQKTWSFRDERISNEGIDLTLRYKNGIEFLLAS